MAWEFLSNIFMSNHKFNEMKYRILNLLFYATEYLSPKDIAEKLGANLKTTKNHLSRLSRMYHRHKKSDLRHSFGYIWRKKEWRKGRRNKYCYRFLKPDGLKIFYRLDERVKIRRITGIFVPLNLNKPIPYEARMRYQASRQ
jgi:hypothetical protein